jgi:putative membrane protein
MWEARMSTFVIIKALHIIGVICWFAGLFYIVRLYIYHVEAEEKPAEAKKILQDQFKIMERRLWYGITVPSMWVTAMMGGHLVGVMRAWIHPWFHIKSLGLILLFWYHHKCGKIRKQLELGTCTMTSKQLRAFNEVPTLLMFLIVFAVVIKSPIYIGYAMAGFAVFAALLFFLFRKRLQGKSSKAP